MVLMLACASVQIVTAVPEVRQLALQSGDEFLLLACDGIWDVLTNQEVRRCGVPVCRCTALPVFCLRPVIAVPHGSPVTTQERCL